MDNSNQSAVRYFLKRYRSLFVCVLIVTIASSVAASFSVVAFYPVFSSLLGESRDESSGILGFVVDIVDFLPFSNAIVGAAALLFLVFLVKTILALGQEILTAYFGARTHYEVKREIAHLYTRAHYQYMLDHQQGTLIYNSLHAPTAVSGMLSTGTLMATAVLKTLTITAILLAIMPWATLVMAALGLAYYGSMHYLSKRVSFQLGLRKVTASTGQTIIINEFLSGFRQILTVNGSRIWGNRFDAESRTIREVEFKEAVWQGIPRPFMELASVVMLLGLILIMWLPDRGSLTDSLPTIGVFAVALTQLMAPLTTVGALRMKMMSMLPNLQIVHRLITGPFPVRREGQVALETFNNSIVLEDVSFAYQNREPIFDRLNLAFEKGSVTAIVGSSGAGKTTVLNLILGLFAPTSGRITVDGVPLQDITEESWFERIGFVSQEPFTYHASVSDNILLGRGGYSREAVIEAAKVANAHEFVIELPQGYDTVVGERGMKISGGQQQRLAIARAVLGSPDILIFDEATSNLDNVSERLVQESIDKLSVDRTVIVIAHRLSTISHADKIVVFENGKMVEAGKHDELLSKDGHYARLAGTR